MRSLFRRGPGWLLLTFAVMGLLTEACHAVERLHIAVPRFPPYVTEFHGQIRGLAVDWITRLLDRNGVPYSLRMVPNYGRALQELKSGRIDAFLLASENDARDRVATFFVGPFRPRWCWFVESQRWPQFQEPEAFQAPGVRIGTLINTNTQYWLVHHHYPITIEASSTAPLPQLLIKYHRLDAVLLSEAVFIRAAEQAGINPARYRCVVHSTRPMGIYVSHRFAREHRPFYNRLKQVLLGTRSISP